MYPRDKGRFALIDGVETCPPTSTATPTLISTNTTTGVCGAGVGEASSGGGSV